MSKNDKNIKKMDLVILKKAIKPYGEPTNLEKE